MKLARIDRPDSNNTQVGMCNKSLGTINWLLDVCLFAPSMHSLNPIGRTDHECLDIAH
jgi:hypothetical protein